MTWGTKDGTFTNGKGLKVKYHCHATLDTLAHEIKEIKEANLLVEKITPVSGGYWRIDYFENLM